MVVKNKYELTCVSGTIDGLSKQIETLLNEDSSWEAWKLHGSPFVFEDLVHQYLYRKTILCLQPDGEYK